MFDHQTVKAVAITQPLLQNEDGDEISVHEFVAYCARVSNKKNQNNHETAPKLVDYLKKNKHWSPLEMAHATIEIVTTRDIARQILRHRSFSFQEFSTRYSSEIEFIEPRETRLQDEKNRQNSIDTSDENLKDLWEMQQIEVTSCAKRAYDWAIQNGVAKEQARSVLPEGLTVSKLYMSGTLRSWHHYCQLRTDAGVQKEHRDIAIKCQNQLAFHLPEFFGKIETQSKK